MVHPITQLSYHAVIIRAMPCSYHVTHYVTQHTTGQAIQQTELAACDGLEHTKHQYATPAACTPHSQTNAHDGFT